MPFLKRASILLAALLLGAQVHAADGLHLQEQQIKAGLLYNFLKYTNFPTPSFTNPGTITICVFGDDPFSGDLQPIAGRTVNQREIVLRSIHDIDAMANCQLLFVNEDEKSRWPRLHAALAGKNVLTVSDFENFTAHGGMIEFGHADNHIRVNLNMEALTAAGLRVEDRLLRLVTVVHGGTHE